MINKIKSNSREIITMLILLFFISCDKPKNNAEEKIFRYVKSYQYHEKDVTDFSFLSKYKNLEILDLTGTSVEDLSFLKHITKLKFLILIDTKVKSLDSIKHLENLEELHLKGTNVKDLSPLKKLKKLNIDGQFAKTIIDNSLSFQNIDIESLRIHDYESFMNVFFEDISSLSRFENLKQLEIALKNDNYIDYLAKVPKLEELSLWGTVHHLPKLPAKLKKLYLYDVDLMDFSFLKGSNLKELYIVARFYKDRKHGKSIFEREFNEIYSDWDKLKKEYPSIKIEVKNKLFMPTQFCEIKNPSMSDSRYYLEDELGFGDIYLYGDCYIIRELRNDNLDLDYELTLSDYKVLINEVGVDINYLWGTYMTFLDKAIIDKNKRAIEYLKDNGAKKSCEIFKMKCDDENNNKEVKKTKKTLKKIFEINDFIFDKQFKYKR